MMEVLEMRSRGNEGSSEIDKVWEVGGREGALTEVTSAAAVVGTLDDKAGGINLSR